MFEYSFGIVLATYFFHGIIFRGQMKRIVLYLLLLLPIFGCTVPNEPKGTSWDIALERIPLLRGDTILLSQEIESVNILTGEDSVLVLSDSGQITLSIDDRLSFGTDSLLYSITNPASTPTAQASFGFINNELTIHSGTFLQCSLYIDFENSTSVGATVTLEIKSLVDENDNHLELAAINILPGQKRSIARDISGWRISTQNGSITIETAAYGDFNQNAPSEHIDVSLKFKDQEYESVVADFAVQSESFPPISIQGFSQSPGTLTNIRFTLSKLLLTFDNLPVTVDPLTLSIQSRRGAEQLSFSTNVTAPENVITTATIDKDVLSNNVSIVDIVSQFPDEITLSGSFSLVGTNVTIERNKDYKIQYKLEIPLDFSAPDGIIEETKKLTIDDDARDAIEDNLVRLEIHGEVENFSSFSGTVSFLVGTDISSVENILLSDELKEATLNDGVVSEARRYKIQTTLDTLKIRQLIEAKYYKYKIELNVNHGTVRTGDYIILHGVFMDGIGKIDL